MSSRAEDIEATPFDRAWSTLSSFLLATAITVFLLLTIGDAELFDNDISPLTDGGVVGTAYFGGLVLSVGLTALAGVGHAAVASANGPHSPPWPRDRRFEDDDGPRSQILAVASLIFVVSLPLIVIYVCCYKYITKSRIAPWDGPALQEEFWASRITALGYECGDVSACFRMYPSKGAPEWFLWSDLVLLVLVLVAIGAWGTLAFRMRRRSQVNERTGC